MAGFSYIRKPIFGSRLSWNERFTFGNRHKPYAQTVVVHLSIQAISRKWIKLDQINLNFETRSNKKVGLSIYKLDQTKSYLANIESISDIADALNELENKSGITIDEYGKTRLYLDHIVFLNDRLTKNSKWKEVFEISIREGYGLIIEGD